MTDITELALIAKIKKQLENFDTVVLKEGEALALVEALEKAQQQIVELQQGCENDPRIHEIIDLKERIAELDSSGIAPGILRCTECSFVLTKNIISVTADTITTVESESEPCPNGCGQLQPATWKALAIQLLFTTTQGVSDLLESRKRVAELESFRTAYMEWSDKTDWARTDKRFDVLKPWGKHLADVLKEYIEHLESHTVTVKLLDCDLAAVQHMSGGSTDYCNGFVDGTQNAIRAMRAAGVDVREAE